MLKSKNFIVIWISALLTSLLFVFGTSVAHAENPKTVMPDSVHAVVTDHAGILDNETMKLVADNETKFSKIKQHPQVALLTIKSSEGQDLSDYIEQLYKSGHWGVGQKGENNGILIVFAKNKGNNNVYISTEAQSGTYMTDSQTQDILQANKKLLKSKSDADVNKGLRAVVTDVSNATLNYYKNNSKAKTSKGNTEVAILALIFTVISAFFVTFVVLSIIYKNGSSFDSDSDFGSGSGFGSDSRSRRDSDDDFTSGLITGGILGSAFDDSDSKGFGSSDDDSFGSSDFGGSDFGSSDFGGGFGDGGGSGI